MQNINEVKKFLNNCLESGMDVNNYHLSDNARLQLHQMYIDKVWVHIGFRYGVLKFNKRKRISEIIEENYTKTAWGEVFNQLRDLSGNFIGWSNLTIFIYKDIKKNGDPWAKLRMPDISCLISEVRTFEMIYALEDWVIKKNLLNNSLSEDSLQRVKVLLKVEAKPYKKIIIEKIESLDTENADVLEFLMRKRSKIDKMGDNISYSRVGDLFTMLSYEPVEKWAEIILRINDDTIYKDLDVKKAYYKSFQDSMLEYVRKPDLMQRFISTLDIESIRESAIIFNKDNQTIVIDFEAFRFLSDAISMLDESVNLPKNSPLYRLTNINMIENVKIEHALINLKELILPILKNTNPAWDKALTMSLEGSLFQILKIEVSKDVENSKELYLCMKAVMEEAFYNHCLDDNIEPLCNALITEAVMKIDREKVTQIENVGKVSFKKF